MFARPGLCGMGIGRLGLMSASQATLLQQAIAAIKRNNGTLIMPAATLGNAYTDSTGATPATTVGDVLGLVLDRSYGGALGAELVSNGTFDSGTTGWTAGPKASITAVGGELQVTAAATNAAAFCVVPTVVDRSYRASCIARAGTSSAAQLRAIGGSTVYTLLTSNTPLTFVFTATSTSTQIDILAGTAGTLFADNISVKEIPGNHATQSTTANKPTVQTNAQGRYVMRFDGSNDSLTTNITTGNEGWVCAGVTFGGADSAIETVFHSGAEGVARRGVWIARVGSVSTNALWCGVSDGVVRAIAQQTAIALKSGQVVVEAGWTAANVFASVNGVQGTTVTRSGDATPPTNLATIGVIAGGGGTYLNGPMTAQVICPVLPSASDRAIIRKCIGSLQGQSL